MDSDIDRLEEVQAAAEGLTADSNALWEKGSVKRDWDTAHVSRFTFRAGGVPQ
jgi:hypothetical protein